MQAATGKYVDKMMGKNARASDRRLSQDGRTQNAITQLLWKYLQTFAVLDFLG